MLRGNINTFWFPTTFLIQLPDYHETLAATFKRKHSLSISVLKAFNVLISDKNALPQRNRKPKQEVHLRADIASKDAKHNEKYAFKF